MPISELCYITGSMWYVSDLFGMDLTTIFHSFNFVDFDPPVFPTVIGLVGGILYSFFTIGSRYLDFLLCLPHPNPCCRFYFCVGGF